jgi:hypothetical protein
MTVCTFAAHHYFTMRNRAMMCRFNDISRNFTQFEYIAKWVVARRQEDKVQD